MPIERLPPETVDRIAAGEVVTRPAAVVKELIENALDAGASRIDVAVDGDGTERIRVADDGCGIANEEVPLAVERHATSKLGDDADLERVGTLGFRGEALPSIAEAATLELTTNDGDGAGTRLVVGDGERTLTAAGRAPGTTVEVRDLFADRPARRKSLAGVNAEFARVSDVVSRYALTRPDVRFSLAHGGRTTFSTYGSGDYADAVLGVYDRTVAGEGSTFEHEATVELDGRERTVRVEGFLAYPSVTRATREHVYTAINGRTVTDDTLRRTTEAGYGTLLPSGRHPVAVVSVSLPTELVDVNVHPAKTRVAYVDSGTIADVVETAVREVLTTADLRRTGEVAMDLDSSLDAVDGDSPFDDVRVIGQFRDLYVLCEADDDLLVIDQHAAHERVNYERLQAALADEAVETRSIDPPATLSFSPGAAETVEANRPLLEGVGFAFAPFGRSTYRVTGVPAPLGRIADPEAFREAVDALRAGDKPTDTRDELLKDLACHPSLKAGDALDADAARLLLDNLGACGQPFACPHGRPTVISLDEGTLAKGFERRGTRMG